MRPELSAIIKELEAARARLRGLAASCPDDRWAARAGPDRWSPGECVAHLNATSRAFIPMLRAALSDERFRGVPAPSRYRRDVAGWLVSIVAGPMPKIAGRRPGRVKTQASFVPAGDAPKHATVADFERLQDELVSITRDADGRPLHRMKIRSPFDPSGRLRYNAYSALVAIHRHQQRHLDQADDALAG